MVLPIIGALVGGVASIASAVIAGNAQSSATQYNWAANEKNRQQRNKERREELDYAEDIRAEEKLGGTNAAGDRSYYKEGEGWVTELGDRNQSLVDHFYDEELPERQAQFGRLAEQSYQTDDVATGLLAQFRRIAKESPEEIENLLLSVASRGISEGTSDAMEVAMRQGLRTGNSNISDIAGSIAREAQNARKDAAVDSKLQAKDYVQASYDSKRSTAGQLYQAFLSSSGLALNPSGDPNAATGGGDALMSQFAQMAQQGRSMGATATARPAGRYSQIEPDMGAANAVGAAGTSLAAMLNKAGSYAEKQNNNNELRNYITGGSQLSLDKGGIFGETADRLKQQQGLF